ncbi:hypothetical protein CL635_00845 [bacterium]|nr:hypothetical protein [bacterium]|tara:strand:- start:17521 stop:17760 length:240 start_codon:yes stop_codon:yes gene_type:complete
MQNDEHAISDLGLASALCCLGYQIVSMDKSEPRRVVFQFQVRHGIEQAIEDYWNGSLTLPPAALFTHQKLLKQRIYATQ